MLLKPFGVVILVVARASSGASCPSQSQTSAGMIMAEKAWVSALEHRSSQSLECILDRGFTDRNWSGHEVSRSTVIKALPGRTSSTLHLSKLKAKIKGRMGSVRGLNTQVGPDGKTVGVVRFTDLFVYREHRWMAVAAQETLVGSGR